MRTLLHVGLALALLMGWTVCAEAAKAKAKKKGAGETGIVTAITKDSITVLVAGNKKKGTAAVDRTFKLSGTTKFQTVKKVKGQKGQTEQAAATLTDVQKGDRVTVQANGETAETVNILQRGKKK